MFGIRALITMLSLSSIFSLSRFHSHIRRESCRLIAKESFFRGAQHKKHVLHSKKDGKDFDFIDAEIIEEKSKTPLENIVPPAIGNFVGNAFNKISKVVGNAAEYIGLVKRKDDEEFSSRRSSSAELKRMRSEVDSAFANTGLIGGLAAQMMKTFGGIMIESMAEANNDIDNVKRSVQYFISKDPACRAVFGSGSFSLLNPTQSSMSSSTVVINGVSEKKKLIQLVIPLESASTGRTGLVEVSAALNSNSRGRSGGDGLNIERLSVSVLGGYGGQQVERVIRVPVTGGAAGPKGYIDV